MRPESLCTFICFTKEIIPVKSKYSNMSDRCNGRYIGLILPAADV